MVRAKGRACVTACEDVTSCDWMSLVVGARIWDLWGSRGRPNTCGSAWTSAADQGHYPSQLGSI